ncbi:WD repeat-containing protein 75 [Anoplophora glabripennis]|uniref:WD repeat-containing protein 75 n=1 Tax=Anoplophora glabripennis TaxID=217634 RepID=UPI000874D51A|nr:WD repeat-containing protein 75 [Anoplophora glabripennis]
MVEVEVALNFKDGGSVVSLKPIFSSDGETLFICCKKNISEYNRKTGKLMYEYQGTSPDNIVGFSYLIYDSYPCLVVCYESGKVTVWRTMTHFKIMEKQFQFKKIRTFNIVTTENTELKAMISYGSKNRIGFTIIDIKKCVSKNFSFSIKLDGHKYFLDVSENKYFSVVYGNIIYFVSLNDKAISRYAIDSTRSFTCIACHPTDEIVLSGDSSGRAIVWRNIFGNKVKSVFHWHTLPVRALCFSTAGSYFYSGGEECVLVKWQLDDENEKKFLPRLAAEIEHISLATNNVYTAVATRDNAVRIVDNQMNQVNVIQHLVLGEQHESGIIYDPRTKALVMNGNPGHVQFYSPNDGSLLYSVDVVGRNRITNERGVIMENTDVTKVAISKNGLWLGTVEERRDKVYNSEIRLKFWKFNSEMQKFELNTSVEYPHDKSVKEILFQPLNNDDGLRCVTLGDDKKFKIWQLVESDTLEKGVVWKCFGIGFFRDFSCSGLSFSVDGSLMAIGFDTIVTAWTPDSCEIKCSLFHPTHKGKIKWLKFGYSNQCHLLVSASAYQLSVWNLLTLCMIWTVPLRVSLLIADPLSTHMAVLTENKKVFVFTPNSPVPLFSNEDLLTKQKNIIAASFVPSKYSNDAELSWYERSHLYFINSKNELYYISSNEVNLDIEDDKFDETKSIFTMMTPNARVNFVQHPEAKKQLFSKDLNQKTFKKFLEAPIQTMAPTRFTCYSILKSLVVQKETVS